MGINLGSQTKRLRKSVGDLTYYEIDGQTISRLKITTNSSHTDLQMKFRCIQGEVGRLSKYFIEPINLGFLKEKKGYPRLMFLLV